MRITETSDLWWKTAVYCLDVETFLDSDGDGVGDLPGLAQRLDHLADLGATCLWLMPVHPTPDRDDGYDVVDLYGVDPRLGTLGDLVEVVRTARDRGMRVIADLVVNRTSDQHPWFRSARASRDSPYRYFYVWRDEPPPGDTTCLVFPDQETSAWQYDGQAGQYYLHRFYRHQPDLNVTNPRVRRDRPGDGVLAAARAVRVPGRRGAVPARDDRRGRRRAGAARPARLPARAARPARPEDRGRVLLGEVNLPYEEQLDFFGGADGDELTLQFDFVAMQRLYLSLARADPAPLVDALHARPPLARGCQWATFVRNHDELTLDGLTDDERAEVFAAFGPDPDMQVYDRGLRRRLPPMLGGDPQRLRMVYSLLFSLPGTPVLFYGEEIGMGENLAEQGRSAVRTPMQWTAGINAGFSTAPASALPGAVVAGEFGPERVNVEAQRHDRGSLLEFVRLLVRRYRESPELGWGGLSVLDQPHRAVLAHSCTWDHARLVALHNLGPEPCDVPLVLDDLPPGTRLVDLLCDGATPVGEDGRVVVPLEAHGFRWLRVMRPGDRSLA